jgi:phage-related protein
MKPIEWLGNTIKLIRSYPPEIRQEIGYNLDKIQRGIEPSDWKPMRGIAPGVKEIRIHDNKEYRVIYVAQFEEAIYVLHAFIKKTEKTAKLDLELAKKRYTDLLAKRKL